MSSAATPPEEYLASLPDDRRDLDVVGEAVARIPADRFVGHHAEARRR